MLRTQMLYASILTQTEPAASAWIQGNTDHPNLSGTAFFYQTPMGGVLVSVTVRGLPVNDSSSGFFGMHIHEFGDCTLPFDKTGNHYNPTNMPHPEHAGDLPPLLNNQGYAWMSFYDDRFTLEDIIGKSLVIHDMRDDFTTQPSGGSGKKIGCGVIRAGIMSRMFSQ